MLKIREAAILTAVRDALATSADFEDATPEELEIARQDTVSLGVQVVEGIEVVTIGSASDALATPVGAYLDGSGALCYLEV